MKKIALVTLLLVLFSLPHQVAAEPLYIEFGEMMTKTKYIVIAEYLGATDSTHIIIGSYRLLVKEVLLGEIKEKIITVKRAQGGVEHDLKLKTICIAFINQEGGFEWVATPHQKNADINTASLYLRGFYDFNAYLVYPSMITVHQVKEYIQKSTMNYHFEGKVHFFSTEEKKMVAGKTAFHVDYVYQYKNSKSVVKAENLPIKDFPKEGKAGLGAWQEPVISVVYEPNLIRPLKFSGEVQKLTDGKNSFEVLFWVEELYEITERMFMMYLDHEAHGNICHEVLIQSEEAENFKLICNEKLGEGDYLIDSKGSKYRYKSFSEDKIVFNYTDGQELIIEYIPINVRADQIKYTRGTVGKFIRYLKISSLSAKVILKKGSTEKILGKYTMVLKRSMFTPNINFKPDKK